MPHRWGLANAKNNQKRTSISDRGRDSCIAFALPRFHHLNRGKGQSIKMAVEGNTMDNKLYNEKASSQAVAHDLTKAYSTLESALRSQLTQQILIKVFYTEGELQKPVQLKLEFV